METLEETAENSSNETNAKKINNKTYYYSIGKDVVPFATSLILTGGLVSISMEDMVSEIFGGLLVTGGLIVLYPQKHKYKT